MKPKTPFRFPSRSHLKADHLDSGRRPKLLSILWCYYAIIHNRAIRAGICSLNKRKHHVRRLGESDCWLRPWRTRYWREKVLTNSAVIQIENLSIHFGALLLSSDLIGLYSEIESLAVTLLHLGDKCSDRGVCKGASYFRRLVYNTGWRVISR